MVVLTWHPVTLLSLRQSRTEPKGVWPRVWHQTCDSEKLTMPKSKIWCQKPGPPLRTESSVLAPSPCNAPLLPFLSKKGSGHVCWILPARITGNQETVA